MQDFLFSYWWLFLIALVLFTKVSVKAQVTSDKIPAEI